MFIDLLIDFILGLMVAEPIDPYDLLFIIESILK